MVFVKDPIASLFEVGYALGLVHDELASQRLRRPRVKVGDEITRCLSAASTIRKRAATQHHSTAAEAILLRLEKLAPRVRHSSSKKRRAASAEAVRGFLAEARPFAAALSPEYGRPWLALGSAVARWEMSLPPTADAAFLRECWKHVRSQMNKTLKWLASQLKIAAKERKRVGSLAVPFRELFWDHWEYDRDGKHYVAGHNVTRTDYKILLVLRLMDGRGLATSDLAILAGVVGAHNNLSRLRPRKEFRRLISRSNPAAWADFHFPFPESYAIPDDLVPRAKEWHTKEELFRFFLARVKDIRP